MIFEIIMTIGFLGMLAGVAILGYVVIFHSDDLGKK